MTDDQQDKENGFRSILKGTSIFGGVQIFNILISAIRIKFVAVILGPSGMGIAGLFNTASLTIQQFASLGLNLSVVKEVGQNKEEDSRLANVLTAIRPLIYTSSLIGALICLLFPQILSSITFGNTTYTRDFLLLSAAVFFSILGGAFMSVLQGLHVIKPLSKASVVGSVVGLTIGVPLYWIFGTGGIVPAMVVLSISTCTWYFLSLRKILKNKSAQWQQAIHFPLLKKVLMMGLILMSNDLMRNLVNFLVNVYIRSHGGMNEVGFFQSCNTMTSQYSAIVFTAMAMDYLPRLSATAGDNKKMCEVVNRQIEVVGLLIAPIACAVIFLAPVVIEIFQTQQFLVATPLLRLLAFAVAVRALMYPLGYIVFAKDNQKLFFWMESVGANIMTFCLTIGGYMLFGLSGLGYAAIADCIICLCVYVIVNHRLYGYKFSRSSLNIAILSLVSTAMMTLFCFKIDGILQTVIAIFFLTILCIISAKMIWIRIKK